MNDDERMQNEADWSAAISKFFHLDLPLSVRWTDLDAMVRVVTPFMGEHLNYTSLPRGGGWHMESIARSRRPGWLELISSGNLVDVFRPLALYFEHLPEAPLQSFFLFEITPWISARACEKSDWEDDEVLQECPGKSPRVVTEHREGKILIAALGSFWNAAESTQDGEQSRMSAAQIREQIERAAQGLIEESGSRKVRH